MTGGRVRQLQAALKVRDLELRALREVLGGRVRQVLATVEFHSLEPRAPLEVLGGSVRQLPAACKIRCRLRLNCFFRDRLIAVGERAPDQECLVLLK